MSIQAIINPEERNERIRSFYALLKLEKYSTVAYAFPWVFQKEAFTNEQKALLYAIRGFALTKLGEFRTARQALQAGYGLQPSDPIKAKIMYVQILFYKDQGGNEKIETVAENALKLKLLPYELKNALETELKKFS